MGICFLYGQTGGGAGINLKLVGGTTEPTNPAENTIWVKTNVPISGYVLSATDPGSVSEGLVWLKTTDTGTEINVGKKNAVLLRLANSKLYTGGIWKSFDGYAYVSGEWIHFSSTSPTPDEYQDVEFIEVSGTQYIDTGIAAAKPMRVEADFSTGTDISSDQHLLSSAGYGDDRGYVLVVNGGNCFCMVTTTTKRGSFIVSTNTRYKDLAVNIGATVSECYLQHDGVQEKFSSYPGSINDRNLFLFACNGNTGKANTFTKCGKLFRMKIYKYDELVADFVPCYRISDHVAGLYDIQRGAFFTNAGTGEFIVGVDV